MNGPRDKEERANGTILRSSQSQLLIPGRPLHLGVWGITKRKVITLISSPWDMLHYRYISRLLLYAQTFLVLDFCFNLNLALQNSVSHWKIIFL